MSLDNSAYWDSVAGKKTFATPIPYDFIQKHAPTPAAVLDVGCGYGRVLKELHERGFRKLYGTDCSAKMIELAKAQLEDKATLSVGEAGKLNYPDESFDIVFLAAVLTSITEIKAEQQVVQEVRRVLRPGGLVVVNDMLISNKGRPYKFHNDEFGLCGVFLADGRHPVKHCSEERFKALFADFEFVKVEKLEWLSMNGNPDLGISFVARKAA